MSTISGWIRNGWDALAGIWTEPLTWLVLAVAIVIAALVRPKASSWSRPLAIVALGVWLVSTLALTIYPLDAGTPPTEASALEIEVFIPFASTVDAFANSGDRPMTTSEYQSERERIARDFDIPIEEVELDPVFHGSGAGVIIKDIVGNILVFVGLGLLAPIAALATRSLDRILLLATPDQRSDRSFSSVVRSWYPGC